MAIQSMRSEPDLPSLSLFASKGPALDDMANLARSCAAAILLSLSGLRHRVLPLQRSSRPVDPLSGELKHTSTCVAAMTRNASLPRRFGSEPIQPQSMPMIGEQVSASHNGGQRSQSRSAGNQEHYQELIFHSVYRFDPGKDLARHHSWQRNETNRRHAI